MPTRFLACARDYEKSPTSGGNDRSIRTSDVPPLGKKKGKENALNEMLGGIIASKRSQ